MTKAYISDVHSNVEALEAVLADIASKGITEVVFLGDLYGYGPNPNEITDIAMASDWKMHSGNHDAITAATVESRVKNQTTGRIEPSMGDVAYNAMDAQIGIMFTDNPHEYLSPDYVTKLIGSSNIKNPEGMIRRIRVATDEAIENAEIGRISRAATSRRVMKHAVGKALKNNVPSLLFDEAFKFMRMNPDLYRKMEAQQEAVARYEFIQELGATPNYALRDGKHCFHCPEWGDQTFAYLLDDNQREIRTREGISIGTQDYTIDSAMEAAKRAAPSGGHEIMLHGHDHTPSKTTIEDGGVKLTLISTGEVGWPRLKENYNVGTYVIEDDNGNFRHEKVEYDWEAVHDKLKERNMPQNKVWELVKA